MLVCFVLQDPTEVLHFGQACPVSDASFSAYRIGGRPMSMRLITGDANLGHLVKVRSALSFCTAGHCVFLPPS